MKSLKPSHKENKRYLLVRGKNPNKNIEKAILDYIGQLGLGKTGLAWIKTSKEEVIISINRESLNEVRAAITIWPDKMEVIRVSGTIKGLKVR